MNFSKKSFFSVGLSVLVSVLLVTTLVEAATTISTSIVTGGTLTVSGTSNSSIAGMTGFASTTPWGALSINPTALGSGVPEFVIGSSSATHVLVDGAGRVGVGSSTPYVALGVTGTTTSSLGAVIGSAGTPISQLLFGTCTPTIGNILASSSMSAFCTGSEAVNGTGFKVFVTPNLTERNLIFESASSTASGIEVTVYNTGVLGTINPTDNAWSWMAIR